MDFKYSEEQEMIKTMVDEFAKKEIAPGVWEREKSQEIPFDIIKKMGSLGLVGDIPKEYGGSGMSLWSWNLVMETIARYDQSFLTVLSSSCNSARMLKFRGSEEQKQKWLPPIARGESFGSSVITEPDAGSWVRGMKTTAVFDGDEWVINGSKIFITDGGIASYCVVSCRTGDNEFSSILVPAGTPGFQVLPKYPLLALRAGDNRQLFFDNCRVPKENLVGEQGEAIGHVTELFCSARVGMGSHALGVVQALFDECLSYAKSRQAWGKSIARFQRVQDMLVELHTTLELMRLLRDKTVWMIEQGIFDMKMASTTKLYCTEAANRCAYIAVQLHGGYGLMDDGFVGRAFRNVRYLTIADGTSEIQKLIIAHELGC